MAFERIEAELLVPLALKDSARHYFVCYTINNNQKYEDAWHIENEGKSIIGILLRKTGLVQIIWEPGISIASYKREIEALLEQIPWKKANVTEPLMQLIQAMHFKTISNLNAYIASCSPAQYLPSESLRPVEVRRLTERDLDAISEVYKEVFKGFASRNYMAEKLASGRGRALGVFLDDTLVSVSQSDYETEASAILVGVATRVAYQSKGYGRVCFETLMRQLVGEGKTLFLQYDSPIAGALYISLGFEVIENNYNIERIVT